MFRKKTVLWGFLIGLLVLLNLWRWLPGLMVGKGRIGAGASDGFQLDFPSLVSEEEKAVNRDLFSTAFHKMGQRVVKAPKITFRLVPGPQPTAPPPSADGSILEAVGGYRLMGVASREGKSQALIGRGDQLFQVKPGDDIEGRYQVKSVTDNEVYLTEKQTGNTLKLRIWDDKMGETH